MNRRVLPFVTLACLGFLSLGMALVSEDPSTGATAAGQSVADALKEFTGSDVALVPAALLKDPNKKEELDEALAFKNDGVVVVQVSGAMLKIALERSISAFPRPNVGFLQVAGIEATFKKGAPANSRIVSVTVGGAKLEDGKTYAVAMPISLQQGQLGYSSLWEDSKIVKRFDKTTLADVVKGRRVGSFSARWSAQA